MSKKPAASSILITGFPGFLSNHLVRHLAESTPAPLELLCLRNTESAARRQLRHLDEQQPGLAQRTSIWSGDITEPKLGLGSADYTQLSERVGIVYHLAALYDLAVAERVAYEVNVGGTVHLLDFCEACDDLRQLNYISTCYVAGERTGTIYEDELDVGQHHKNHYEATKFWAEVEVQRRWRHIPTAIFRPGIVIGDSKTGATTKYDGPYYVFQLLHGLPEWLPVPNIGSGDAVVNLVPVDFVAQALAHLGLRHELHTQVYHLADPEPMGASEIVDGVLQRMGRRPTMGRLPAAWVDRALKNGTIEQWTGVPRQALTYFNHDAYFDTTHAREALSEQQITCPPLSAYLDRIVDFFLRHPDEAPTDFPADAAV